MASISITTHYVSPDDSLPPLALQITRLVGSYMLWVGMAEGGPERVEEAPLKGNLAKDWACAMPSAAGGAGAATALFRTSGSDVALSMAQRLGRAGPRVLLEAERAIVTELKALETGVA
ncbi:uncharacterized protein SCHCODRAFT_02510857 [Schizophyllum commune H4-8]|uniref:Uncharacterized protein n=1 Tax=Schizophyllum commune (strain H4-8 / FGSC 9210) TaxID=578458 RepID=D8QCI0_SCHCM|nr:uncharacterized protein SCHCODRAFT_02510857 [Schizophyllum commune H4-8]KAI5889594.1 hypothetical protein SCHCODRAFT_02510857 [Schizophyllum commune H4-8]